MLYLSDGQGGNTMKTFTTVPLKRKLNTTVRLEGLETIVKLYNTDIVTSHPQYVKLNNGGWYTATTRNRINQASDEIGFGVKVFIRKGFMWASDGTNEACFGRNHYIIYDRVTKKFYL